MSETRKLAAILVADVVGYSRLAGADEDLTLARLRALRSDLIDPIIAVHHGRVVKRTGDGAIVEFRSVVDAVRCAIEVQNGMVERNAGLPAERRIEFRVGIHLGDVVEESDGDLMGDGVNIAARLESIAEPNGICLSGAAYEQVRDRLKEEFFDLGDKQLKNIARPVRAYRLTLSRNAAKSDPVARAVPGGNLALPDKPAIAVLAFQNMSGDPEQDYFADGVVDDIITALSLFQSFAVIARNSSFVYKGRAVDVRQVARELGVGYVLEGSVRRAGNRLRITAQLVDGSSGAHLWAEQFDGTMADVFDFQDRITERVAVEVEPHIQSAEIARSRMDRPESVTTYDILLRALAKNANTSVSENVDAYELLIGGLALEPNNALLLAHAAWVLDHRSAMGWPPFGPDDTQRCAELARRGLQHAAGNPTVMAKCGLALVQTAKEYNLGMAVLQSAAEANPNNLMVAIQAGIGHLHCGLIADALAHLHRALRLSPRDPFAFVALTGIAHAQMVLGNYPEALVWATRSLALNPTFDPALWMLIAANAHLGRLAEARRFLDELRRIAPGATVASIRAGQAAKDPGRIVAILDGLRLAGLAEG